MESSEDIVAPDTAKDVPVTNSSSLPLVRMARASDVEELFRLASVGGDGLTNLPPDRTALTAKLVASENALISPKNARRGCCNPPDCRT